MLRVFTEQGFDLFFLWRWMLAVAGGVYTFIKLIQGISRLLAGLEPAGRMDRIKQQYIILHLLRIRVRYFWTELCQIVLLVGLLILIVRMHHYL